MTIALTDRERRAAIDALQPPQRPHQISVSDPIDLPVVAFDRMPAPLRPSDASLRRAARKLGRLVWLLARPLLRPIVWRTRGFLLSELQPQLQALCATQDDLAGSLRALAARPEPLPPRLAALRRPTRLRRKVHQFHAGSATGDAVTNAMLLIQRQLRAAGYGSEIYVEHLGAGLEGLMHPLEALPEHDDHVLLVHHSMGHTGCAQLLAHVAPKLLVYHNITPPELLGHNPHVRRAAELGRRQLAQWRDAAVGAIADSTFNAMELRQLGFENVIEATMLFDADELLVQAQCSARARSADGAQRHYTVLFVGRLVPSKGQLDLVEAFARFADRLDGQAARLILAGDASGCAAAYRQEIVRRIDALGLQDRVTLTGKLSDASLQACFEQADLYVSLSRHEGFGVPLVEAMAHGLPVVALRAGAVGATIGDAGALVESPDPDAVADAMLQMARAPAAAGFADRARRGLHPWALRHHLPRLHQALALAGAAPCLSSDTRAIVARDLVLRVFGSSDAVLRLDTILRKSRPAPADRRPPGLSLTITVDDEQADPADLAIVTGLSFSLEDARRINAGYRALLVPTAAVARTLVDAGVARPVHVIGKAGASTYADAIALAGADLLLSPPSADIRIAWISPWQVRCGIAEYSRHMIEAFNGTGFMVGPPPVVICDQRPATRDQAPLAGVRSRSGFRVGDAEAAPALALAIGNEDPDIVVIQHQPGVLPWSSLADLLASPLLTMRGVVVALHNTADLRKIEPMLRERVALQLSRAARVLVHTGLDIELLRDLGVINTVLLPHGASAGRRPVVPRTTNADQAPVIGTTGFILPHKGLQHLIRATALLRRHWPAIRLRLVTARYPDPISDAVREACEELIAELDLQRNVDWHTDFEPNDAVMERLASCDLLVMPYEATLESCSGAVRQAIASGVPTLVSDLSLFDDLGRAVERMVANAPDAIAGHISSLLQNPSERSRIQGRAQAWLEAHSWATTAERVQGLLEGVVEQRKRTISVLAMALVPAVATGCADRR